MNLLVLQSLWAMENSNPDGSTPPRAESLARIAEAGFGGVTDHFWDRAHARQLSAELKPLGLTVEGQCFPRSVDELQPTLEHGTEFGCHHVTIQADVRTRDLNEAVTLLEGWQKLAEQVDFPVLLETHRNRLTDDIFFTLELIDALPDLKLLGDLSHYVAGHEMALPYPETEGVPASIEQLRRIMANCHAYHGRVASCEQVQLPVVFPQHRPWVDEFRKLWSWGFRNWQERANEGDTLAFTCELGPPPYAITDRNNLDITDRWAESLQLKALAESIWSEVAAPREQRPETPV